MPQQGGPDQVTERGRCPAVLQGKVGLVHPGPGGPSDFLVVQITDQPSSPFEILLSTAEFAREHRKSVREIPEVLVPCPGLAFERIRMRGIDNVRVWQRISVCQPRRS